MGNGHREYRYGVERILVAKNLKTIAAFYNTEGGCMIIGRKDDGTYVGVTNIKK